MATHEDQLRDVLKALTRFKTCIVSAHVNGDGDSFGSQLALARLLRALGKKVYAIADSEIAENLRWLPDIELVERPGASLPAYDALFTVDVPVRERLGKVAELLDPSKELVMIDHHIPQESWSTMSYIDASAAATGEMIYRLYQALDVPVDVAAATQIYVTLLMDTGSFRYASTNDVTHEIAADLIRVGVDPAQIFVDVYERRTPADMRLYGLALRDMCITDDGRFAWMVVTNAMLQEADATVESSEALIDFPRSLGTVEGVFVAREVGEQLWRVSLRSKGRMDVNAVAKIFHGGGHRLASGCRLQGTQADIVAQLYRALQQHAPT